MAARIPLGRSAFQRVVTATCRASSMATRPSAPWSVRMYTAHNTAFARCQSRRCYSAEATAASSGSDPVEPPDFLDEAELDIFKTIKAQLEPTSLEVQDISGGCGSMYALDVTSPKFSGLTVIKQHRLVNEVLGDRIKKWHGVQLKTRAP